MVPPFRRKFALLQDFLYKLPGFSRPNSHSLKFLNSAQFLGALNDNIFKLLLAYFLIDTQGTQHASRILSLTGAIFVIPFLLFSSAAGVLADRFSKQGLLVLMKCAESILMALAIVAFATKSVWASYTILFLISTHTAFFSPAKYSIIPEIVSSEKISRANGLITSFTFLAIIIGTFLASLLTDITNRNFPLTVAFCLLIALVGLISALGIKKTKAQGLKKQLNLLFISEIYKTLVDCREIPHLLMAIFGSAFFLFMGAFTQLNIIPFAINSLHLTEVGGGYLFLSTALGIALGSFIIGKILKKRIELSVCCIAGLLISFFLFIMYLFSSHLYIVIICLFLLGFFAGVFIVPFNSFMQVHSPNGKLGQVVAASNFLSFIGVLAASICLYLFSDVLGFSAAMGFAIIGIFVLLFSLISIARLSDFFFPFFAKWYLRTYYSIQVPDDRALDKSVLIVPNATVKDALLLLGAFPNIQFLVLKKRKNLFATLFYSVDYINKKHCSAKYILELAQKRIKKNKIPCIILPGPIETELFEKTLSFKDLLKPPTEFLYVNISSEQKRNITIFLTKDP